MADTSPNNPLQRHKQFFVSLAVGLVVFAAVLPLIGSLPVSTRLAYSISIAADSFFVVFIALVIAKMPLLSGRYLSKNARELDLPVLGIFAITLGIVAMAIVLLFLLINHKDRDPIELGFAMLSIPLGWFTIHAMAALHYAHVYWMDGDAIDAETKKKIPVGGLDFPGSKRPDGWDFLYFATVIGMTAQTADTAITTSHMRRVVLVHSILSFFFNAVIVAAVVNLAVSLGN
ncbi:membrane protein [Mesorhizobium sp. LSJC268A00]|jgi:uncharacterized membrane protein|uniref:DUF1345 domain-containing protein n=1 Tax=unclassified Mesorhizobium TaxID=325217 RepID=UPI0003CF51AD|nr:MULTISPECIES: DUF1345 domain-containing protein [unclassified Mesorhizobium]ESW88156.1 membrane protein [Mesorhizobium sp. LSJC269B00]ESX05816.1 membrane protein [Mesorhizobium sp. LSJC268A00]ESX14390.1 membrane protein [Mesorhizobium sp. LSJC265A00]ESX23181.1 membrane protein [Mesorhizobium sp. LSJC264A00]ESX50105.1 membrane protein [Mesorhizobium sp. LSHC426A00]